MTEEELAPAALVLTQVAVAEGLAAACAMHRLEIDAVPTPIGAVAVCRSTQDGAPERVAGAVSQLLAEVPVVLVEQRGGRMSAARWTAGVRGEELSPALVLDGAPAEVEALLLGQVRAADLPGAVSSAGLSRWRAARLLARHARLARRGRSAGA